MIILTDKTIVIPVGISPNYSGVNKPSLEDKSVEITANGDYSYTASEAYYGIGNFNVKVNVPFESDKTVNPSFVEDVTVLPSEGFDAMSSVIVKKAVPNLEDKSVQITENGDYGYTTSAPYNGIGNLNVNVNVQEKKIRYAIRPTSGRVICPLTNVLLNETSWVSLDFAMDTSSLNKEKACLFGISASSLHCYLNNGVLHMYTGEEVPMNKQITLDTNKHTLEFGFVSKADASGHAEFEVIFDGEMIADVMVLVPKFNLPLSLFDVPNAYDGTYDDYIAGGGITHIVNGTGYGAGDSVFDLFALTVYDKPAYYRQTINAYTPSVDAGNKPIFIDNITGEYQYPASGAYSYSKIDGDTRTEIASATYTMPFSNDFQYFRPSAGAIVPTDIELPALHRITMYVKDIDDFDGGTSDSALDNVKNRAMIGAQPTLVSPFNHIDYEKGLPWLDINEENTAKLADASGGIYYKVVDHFGYSILTEYGGTPQKLTSFSGEHIIKCGVRREGNASMWKTTSIDSDGESQYLWQGKVPDKLNNFNLAPLCIFGTYNEVEGTNPDYVNSLGYQEALNQIGYKTGVRYAVKQIDIEEHDIVQEGGNIIDKTFLKHRLVTLTDSNGVNCLFDTITGTTYYPYNGTLDVYTGPVEPEEPAPTILTNTYIKPSAGAIVPTDIKFTSLTNVTMHVKGFDNFNDVTDVNARALIGAQPDLLVSPINLIDVERGLPFLDSTNQEYKDFLGDTGVAVYFAGCGQPTYSLYTENGSIMQKFTMDGEHIIKCGYDAIDPNNINMEEDRTMWKIMSIDGQENNKRVVGPTSVGIYQAVTNEMKTPICIFGTYNNTETTPDEVISLGYENALNQIGYTTGVRYGVKQIDINVRNADGSMTTTHSLVPARDTNNTICIYDTVANKSYYPYNGTLDVYTPPVEPEPPVPPVDPEPPVPPTILTDAYIKPSAGAIVPTDIKFTSLTKVKMLVKGFNNVSSSATNMDSKAMIGAQPNFIVSPFMSETSPVVGKIGIYFNGGGSVLRSTDGKNPQAFNNKEAQLITVGYRPKDINNINIDNDKRMLKIINFGRYTTNMIFKEILPTSTTPNSIYKFIDDQMTTPICIFGNYNNPESMTPDDVIALGYENALNQIGYVTGTRYGVKYIDIIVYNTDGSETTTHSLVPARDKDGVICLYDEVNNKSYYPFHGTLDII